jgi:hypothetical protein
MTTNNLLRRYGLVLALLLTAVCGVPATAFAADLKLEAVLVWGTNGDKPEDSDLKPVTEDIARKMNCLPFKYTNYFEVNRKKLTLPEGGTQKAKMSKDCSVTVKSLADGKIELTLMGKGQPACKITQELKAGKCLVTGGNAQNSTAWFVVIKQTE